MYLNHFFVTDTKTLIYYLFIMLRTSIFYSTAPPRDHKICSKILVRSQSIDGFDEETGRMRWGRNAHSGKPSAVDVGKNPLDTLSAMAARGHPASCARLFRLLIRDRIGADSLLLGDNGIVLSIKVKPVRIKRASHR